MFNIRGYGDGSITSGQSDSQKFIRQQIKHDEQPGKMKTKEASVDEQRRVHRRKNNDTVK